MADLIIPAAIIAAALAASTTAAVAGFGGAVILLPILVWAFGIRDAVPILSVVQLVGNLSRVYFNRKEVVLPVVGWFASGAVPLSVLGATLFTMVPPSWLQRLLGVFLLMAVGYRHTSFGRRSKLGLRSMAIAGAGLGFLSALLGTVGPLAAAFFLSFGLVKGAYIGTDALAAVVMHLTKLPVYQRYALLDLRSLAVGLSVGVVMIVGSFLGKRLLERMPERVFKVVIEVIMVASGLQFLLFT